MGMKHYRIYIQPDAANPLERAQAIPEGFSFFAFIFHVFWALYHRLWLFFVVIVLVLGLLGVLRVRGFAPDMLIALELVFYWLVGLEARDQHADALERQGYEFCGDVLAANEEQALQRWWDHQGVTRHSGAAMPASL